VVVSVADSAELLSSSDSEDEVVVSFAVSVELPHVRFTLVVIQSAHHPYCLQDGRRRNTRR
jgi:hypothetical protein